MRILIADDHTILRHGLKQILEEEFPQLQFGEATTTTETLQLLRNSPWDLLILDITMPGRGGLEVLAETSRDHPNLPVLVLSSSPEDQLAVRTLKAGASGYLNKRSAAEELVSAVRKVMTGGKYVSSALAEKLVTELRRDDERPPHELLSQREFQVFRMLLAGQSVKAIAGETSLSVKTISTFRARIMGKLGLRNNVELVHYAQQHDLLKEGQAE